MKYIIWITIILLITILAMLKIQIRIKRLNKIDIDLFISKLFRFRIDIDEIISKQMQNSFKKNKEDIYTMFESIRTSKGLIQEMLLNAKIKKLTIIPTINIDNHYLFTLQGVIYWQMMSFVKSYVDEHFNVVSNDYYNVIFEKTQDNKSIKFDLLIELSLIQMFIISIKNLKTLFKLKKIRRKNNGESSN